MREPPATASLLRDPWILVLAALHLGHSLWFARLYPDGIHDPDLLAYFVYFKNWASGTTSLHDVACFLIPNRCSWRCSGPWRTRGSPSW
jgi:hypothetical protein